MPTRRPRPPSDAPHDPWRANARPLSVRERVRARLESPFNKGAPRRALAGHLIFEADGLFHVFATPRYHAVPQWRACVRTEPRTADDVRAALRTGTLAVLGVSPVARGRCTVRLEVGGRDDAEVTATVRLG